MYRKILTVALWLLATGLWAQNDDGAKIVTASQTIQKIDSNNNYTIQIGAPFLGENINSATRTTNPLDVRFPWDVLYLFETFAEESFDVSKGYFGDKVLISWILRNNTDRITNINIYRRIYNENNIDQSAGYENIASASPDATQYEDQYIEGGTLYEYKIEAEGVSLTPQLYKTFITGIGFRNPTAIVTGNVNFKGGNPVKDVIIKATSEGSAINFGSALKIPSNGQVEILDVNNPITTTTTLQAWVRPETSFQDNSNTSIRLFGIQSKPSNENPEPSNIDVNLRLSSNTLNVNIGGSEYNLHNYIPSGELNSRGDDILIPVTDFNENYVHFSVAMNDGEVPLLYINGRLITEAYKSEVHQNLVGKDLSYTEPYFNVDIPAQTNTLSVGGSATEWWNVYLGSGKNAFVDEIRVWNTSLDSSRILTDYRRYINGNHPSLVSYLSANENTGRFAYDLSRKGFSYNKNNGKLWSLSTAPSDKVLWVSGSGNIPTSNQLGILGVTDENGNYEITSIPYSGTGESFKITPLFGQHQFEPAQQLVFLGQGSEVVNKINFIDISSFVFKGKILYDSRGVFKSFVEVNGGDFAGLTDGDEYVSGPGIIDEGYNYYEKNGEKFSKGEYWLNTNGNPDDASEHYLERYAKIMPEGVNIYIDGNIVLDENNTPITSDSEGNFEVSVPIGNHFITLKKDGHEFAYNGRFPAETGTYKEFFEDAEEQVIFVDETKVTLVGRIVGGAVEAQKVIGFGHNGLFEKTIDDNEGNAKSITISSKNNIGVAAVTLGYDPPGSGNITNYTRFNFVTNEETGEYRVDLLPLNYEIDASTGIRILNNNDAISFLDANESVNASKVEAVTIPEYIFDDESIEIGEPYHYEKSFTYRSIPILKVVEQTSDKEVEINGQKISTEGFEHPVYSQFRDYKIVLNSFERYINYDEGELEDLVPVIDGNLNITNNLALPDSESMEFDPKDQSIINYTFKGGFPSISPPFTRNINIKYRINDVDYEAENYIADGIILGGISDGSQTFTTAAPDVPDIILRDPPGSNSFASIEEGQSITLISNNSFFDQEGGFNNTVLMAGAKFSVGGGVAGPVVATESVNNIGVGIGVSGSSNDGKSLTKTYHFSQTISTSDDPDWVGADADLYIGNSKNYFYSSFDNVQIASAEIGDPTLNLELKNIDDESIYISKQKGLSMVEEPSETFFVFTQKHILETLIPEYELFISNIENGLMVEGVDGVLTISQYEEQIRLWKKMVLENEKDKYLAINNRDRYKADLTNTINDFNSEIESAIEDSDDPLRETLLKNKLEESNTISNQLNNYFKDNISFDAGVGEITRSVETSTIKGHSHEFNLTIDESVSLQLGVNVNKTGVLNSTEAFFQQDIYTSLSEEEEETTTISYTLKDNDEANLLSVDIINYFDGNGPVFSTLGGRSSCPYEGPEESKFFTKQKFDEYFSEYFSIQEELRAKNEEIRGVFLPFFPFLEEERDALIEEARLLEQSFINQIDCCPDDEKAQFSFATERVEVPLLSVVNADVSNVLENRNAEFELILENNSLSETDADFLLIVDNLSNPNNALINIEQNGSIVHVPYGQTVPYKMTLGKSISDVYDYENIRVVLQSLCDGDEVSSEVFVSAHFVPTCSEVVINTPLNNFVYNNDTAYNLDGSTNPLMINLIGYDVSFDSFQKIDLEYRLATSPNWSRLQTYYGSQESYDAALLNNESEISLIDAPTLSFAFNIAELQLQDGNYEIRAKSSCFNNTEFISEVISGKVDLNAPKRFGTPLPTNGILGAGEDLKVSFNEAVFYNSAISNIEIKGQTNQLPINHNVSLHFEGADNTAVINKPSIVTGDFTLEFWMNNSTQAPNATIIDQEGGLNIGLSNGEISFTLGGLTAKGVIANDGLFHHYTFTHKNSTGEISIYEDDKEIGGKTNGPNLQFTNSNELIIGGNSFIGNIHNLRLWNKTISLTDAYAKMYDLLIGNEKSLIGYWPMTEGRGNLAKDLSRFKHASLNASWDIKPKGSSYEFNNNQYLELDNVDFVLLNNEMDATISFWMKTDVAQEATLFSNGKGDGTDIVQSNGFSNKWAINISNSGTLSLESEGNSYQLTSQSVADNSWHHVTLLFNRLGSLRTYVDAQQVSSNQMDKIGGFSGNKIWLGARGAIDLAGNETIDHTFSGKIDEFRLWNTLRNVEQISRDRFNEVDFESIGLLLYARMNAPDPATGNGPRYYHTFNNQTVIPSNAIVNNGPVNYSNDAPSIKPERTLIKFQVNNVINEDEMILEPVINDWASLEGQTLDITVHRMFDNANNMQESPVTWTAFVKRNEVSWFAEGHNDIVDLIKQSDEDKSFEITLLNKGGDSQPFTISNVPNWLHLSNSTGTIAPDSKVIITATIDKEITPGDYLENLYLETDFGYNEKMQVVLKVLAKEPEWTIDPNDFDYGMNILGRVKIDGIFSTDSYDKIAAFYNGEVRGVANLHYDEAYQEYFAFLSVYSNNTSGEDITFSVWDASQGKILGVTIDSKATVLFKENEVLGSLSNPILFENTGDITQVVEINSGWTWVSLNVNDPNLSNLNALTSHLNLETSDRILSHSPSQLDTYFKNESNVVNSGWSGTISTNGGLSTSKMYKINITHKQSLNLIGAPVDLSNWEFPIKENWNWLAYPLKGNQSINEALAYFDASDGDVIKSQNLFAIYDPLNGWSGTLKYLESGRGYMVKSSKEQTFSYPNYFSRLSKNASASKNSVEIAQEQTKTAFQKYAENMNAIVLLPEGYDKLFVYDASGVLKGIADTQTINDKALSFITIYGENPEKLVFHIGNSFQKKVTTTSFDFSSNAVLGTVANPIILEEFLENTLVFPNPFENRLTIGINVVENQLITVNLYSTTNQLVFTQILNVEKGNQVVSISPSVSPGTYMLQIVMKENTIVKKIIKK